jgi:hypothetical protein
MIQACSSGKASIKTSKEIEFLAVFVASPTNNNMILEQQNKLK